MRTSTTVMIAALLLFAACGAGEESLSPAQQAERTGDQAYSEQNYEGAVESYLQALQAGALKIGIYNNLANAYLRGGRYNTARQQYLKALELDPEYLFGLNNLAIALFLSGEKEQAYQFLSQAQEAFPEISFLHTTYGVFRFRDGDNEGALGSFRKAVELNPDSPAALNNLGIFYLEQKQYGEDALPYLVRAVEKDPENKLFRDSLGWYYFNKGMFAEATIEIGQAFLYDPQNIEVRVHYATVLEWIGKDREALEQWGNILELAVDSETKKLARQHYWEIHGLGVTTGGSG
jgi:Flp pilus assembly protein TadD